MLMFSSLLLYFERGSVSYIASWDLKAWEFLSLIPLISPSPRVKTGWWLLENMPWDVGNIYNVSNERNVELRDVLHVCCFMCLINAIT